MRFVRLNTSAITVTVTHTHTTRVVVCRRRRSRLRRRRRRAYFIERNMCKYAVVIRIMAAHNMYSFMTWSDRSF